MSYLVLARKWRPESFSQVVGQKHVVVTLSAAVETGRIAHAYLFAGPRGVGKTTVARILAKALNCEKGPSAEPCGQCTSCREIAGGRSLDVIEIDGASNRKIEDARGIREAVQYAPLSGRMKVYIIDEAHMLTREAFNALLKTLEEPPPHVVFVLATTEPGKIPDTIASRCQRFDFHRIAVSDIEARLAEIAEAEGVEVGEGALRLVATRADGSMRDAESLLDQLMSVGRGKVQADDVARVLGIPDVDVYFALSDAVAAHDAGAALGALEKALDSGLDPRDLLDGLVEHLRDLLIIAASPDPEKLVGRMAAYRGHDGPSRSLAEDDLVRLVRIGVEAQGAARWSTQPGLIVELAVMRMAKLARTVELEEIVRAVRGSTAGGGGAPGRGSAEGAAGNRGGRATVQGGGVGDGAGAAGRAEAPGGSVEASTDRWPQVLELIRSERPSLAASLADAVPARSELGEVSLRIPNGSPFHRDQLMDRGNVAIMERAASQVFGGSVRVRFEFGDAPRGAMSPRTDPAAGRSPTDDPMVRKVLDMFGGHVKGIRREE